MKLTRVTTKGQEFLCLNPQSGVYWVDTFDATHPRKKRLVASTGEKVKTLALKEGERLIAEWQSNRKTDAELAREATERAAQEAEAARISAEKAKEERRLSILFKEVAAEYEATTEKSSRDADTKKKIKSILKNHLNPFFGEMQLRKITPKVIEGFIAQFQKERPGETLEDKIKYLNAVFRFGAGEKYIDDAIITSNPDPHKEIGRALTEAEQEWLYAAAREDETDYLRVELGLGHGLRPEEVGGIEYSWIGSDMVLRIPSEKTKRRKEPKEIPLRAQTYEIIMARKTRSQSRFVFPMPKDPNRPDLVWRKGWIRLKKKSGIDCRPREQGGPGRLRFDDLRHTWLTQAAKNLKGQHRKAMNTLQTAIEAIRSAEKKEDVLQILTEALLKMHAEKLDFGIAEICQFAQHDIKVFQKKYLHIKPKELVMMPDMIIVPSRDSYKRV